MSEILEDDFQEYSTFTVKNAEGAEVEMAVMDEFEFEKKNYVAAAQIEGDTINEDGLYIYRVKSVKDDYEFEKITDPKEYQKVAEAYMELD